MTSMGFQKLSAYLQKHEFVTKAHEITAFQKKERTNFREHKGQNLLLFFDSFHLV